MAQTPEPDAGECERIIRVVDEEQSLATHRGGRRGGFRVIPQNRAAAERCCFAVRSPGAEETQRALGLHALDEVVRLGARAAAPAELLHCRPDSITPRPFDSKLLLRFPPAAAVALEPGIARPPVATGGYQKRLEQTIGDLAAR